MTNEQKAKAMFHFRSQVNKVLSVFALYGMDIHIVPATQAIESLALQLHDVLNGAERPIHVDWRFEPDD